MKVHLVLCTPQQYLTRTCPTHPYPTLPYLVIHYFTLMPYTRPCFIRPDVTFDSLHYNILSGLALPPAIEQPSLTLTFLTLCYLNPTGPCATSHNLALHYYIYTFAFHKPNRVCPNLSCFALVVPNQTLLIMPVQPLPLPFIKLSTWPPDLSCFI